MLGDLTNQETCYYCQLVIYEFMLNHHSENSWKMYLKTYLSFASAFFLYLAGFLILSRKELRKTTPYPMIALSLLIFGSLLQLNFTELRQLELTLMTSQKIKLYSTLKWFLKWIGVITSGPVSLF